MGRSRFRNIEVQPPDSSSGGANPALGIVDVLSRLFRFQRKLEFPTKPEASAETWEDPVVELDPKSLRAVRKKISRDRLEIRIQTHRKLERSADREALERQTEADRQAVHDHAELQLRRITGIGRFLMRFAGLWFGLIVGSVLVRLLLGGIPNANRQELWLFVGLILGAWICRQVSKRWVPEEGGGPRLLKEFLECFWPVLLVPAALIALGAPVLWIFERLSWQGVSILAVVGVLLFRNVRRLIGLL